MMKGQGRMEEWTKGQSGALQNSGISVTYTISYLLDKCILLKTIVYAHINT